VLEHFAHDRIQGSEIRLGIGRSSARGRRVAVNETQIAHAIVDHWRERTTFVIRRGHRGGDCGAPDQKLGTGIVRVLMSAYADSIPAIELTDCGFEAGVSVIVFAPAWFCATPDGALTIALWAMV
jgi:hypothetical protein